MGRKGVLWTCITDVFHGGVDSKGLELLQSEDPFKTLATISPLAFLVLSLVLSRSLEFSVANCFLQADQGLITLGSYLSLLSK